MADGQPGSLGRFKGGNNWWEGNGVTYSNDPVDCEGDEVEDSGRFPLRVEMMSLMKASARIFVRFWGFTCTFCNSRTSSSVKDGARDVVAIRWVLDGVQERGFYMSELEGRVPGRSTPAWQRPLQFVPLLTAGNPKATCWCAPYRVSGHNNRSLSA